jgi:hypothetical protein
MYQIEEHLAPLPGVVTNSILDESNSDDDSCVEITSVVDENDNELIKWTSYLQLNLDNDEDSDENYRSTQPGLVENSEKENSEREKFWKKWRKENSEKENSEKENVEKENC